MAQYLQIWLSAEDDRRAHTILDTLVFARLLLGGTILGGKLLCWQKDEK